MRSVSSSDVTPEEVTQFWVEEVGSEGWYKAEDALDDEIRSRFLGTWEMALAGRLESWTCGPRRMLGFLILTDQFPRNMFRGDPRSFATDALARSAAVRAITLRWDMRIPEPERQFFYLPLMHSEVLEDQEKALRLILTRMPETGASNLLHARAHREVIRRYGRFPYRNEALGRRSTVAEQAFLADVGYGGILREFQQTEAAA